MSKVNLEKMKILKKNHRCEKKGHFWAKNWVHCGTDTALLELLKMPKFGRKLLYECSCVINKKKSLIDSDNLKMADIFLKLK